MGNLPVCGIARQDILSRDHNYRIKNQGESLLQQLLANVSSYGSDASFWGIKKL